MYYQLANKLHIYIMFYWFSRITQKTNSPRLANIDIDVSPASNSVSSTQHPPFFRPIPSFPNSSILKSSTGNPQKSRVRYLSFDYFMIWNLLNFIVYITIGTILINEFLFTDSPKLATSKSQILCTSSW